MSKSCCRIDAKNCDHYFRRVLWVVLIINVVMFAIEVVSGVYAGSLALLADAVDFLGDSFNYVISLYVLSRSQKWKSYAAIIKAVCMIGFGLWILFESYQAMMLPDLPKAGVMGSIGIIALVSNVICAWLLFRFRDGDSNRQSIWLCSRNDVIGNGLVIAAAAGVFTTLTSWPDLLVASVMATLALTSGVAIIRKALGELKSA